MVVPTYISLTIILTLTLALKPTLIPVLKLTLTLTVTHFHPFRHLSNLNLTLARTLISLSPSP